MKLTTENEILVKDIVGSIRKLIRSAYHEASKISRQFGITGPQSAILRNLLREGSLSSVALSRKLFVTPSNITGIIDRLEKKGLVERVRKKEDRRVVMLQLTEQGVELSKRLPDPIESKLIRKLTDLDESQVHVLDRSLKLVIDLIDAPDSEQTAWTDNLKLPDHPESQPFL